MERITHHAALGFGDKKVRLTWLRILAVYFGALPIVIPLMALAYLHEGAFETVSKLVFFSSLVFVAWVPLRDTAALSVLAHSKARVRRFNALQAAIPITMASLSWLSTTRTVDRASANLMLQCLSVLAIYVGLPLVLFYLRVKTARELEVVKETGRIAKVEDAQLKQVRKALAANEPGTSIDKDTEWRPSPRLSLSMPSGLRGKGLLGSKSQGPKSQGFKSQGFKSLKSAKGVVFASTKVAPATTSTENRLDARNQVSELATSQYMAAVKLQSRVRMKRARRQFKERVTERQYRLRYFAWPIFFTSLGDILGQTLIAHRIDRQELGPEWALYSVALCTLPCIIVLIIDLAKPRHAPTMSKRRPRFSLAHGIFLVGVLGRLATRAATIDAWVFFELDAAFTPYGIVGGIDVAEIAAPLFAMIVHLLLFMFVTLLAKFTVTLVATNNACPHLIFPFQFFDFVFVYSFFSLRSSHTDISSSWLAQQIVLQINIIMRNSGTTDGLIKRYLGPTIQLLLCRRKKQSLKGINPHTDPLVRLQYVARLGWQYDLADVAALLATPTIVSFLVFRDGFFSVHYSGILVLPCHLQNVWIRFCVLLIIKPVASWMARAWLRRRMRRTLLGKKTLHGTSPIAARIMAESKLVGGGGNSDAKVLEAFSKDFTEEEIEAVKDEFSLQGLNFEILRYKLMRKWRYYVLVIVLQLFPAFHCRRFAPVFRSDAELLRDGLTQQMTIPFEPVPISSSWMYMTFDLARLEDPRLRRKIRPGELANCSSDRTWTLPYYYHRDQHSERPVKTFGPFLVEFYNSTVMSRAQSFSLSTPSH